MSGPLLDRLDVHVNVPPVEVAALVGNAQSETSATIRERAMQARQLQLDRARRGEVDVRRIGKVQVGSEAIGNRTRVRAVKNKCARPFGEAEFDIRRASASIAPSISSRWP